MLRLTIGLLSARTYTDRRQLCRETWIPNAQACGWEVKFLLGHRRGCRIGDDEPDCLAFDVPDGYQSLSMKTHAWCRWLMQQDDEWDYAFKADDDTWVHVPRLAAGGWTGDQPYIGAEWRPGVRYGSGGAGYLMDRKCVQLVADNLEGLEESAEDLAVGRMLRRRRVRFTVDGRFVPYATMERRPRPDNDLITAHARFREFHDTERLFWTCEEDFRELPTRSTEAPHAA